MATTLNTLVSKLATELKMDTNHKIWPLEQKQDFINEAYLQVQADGLFNWSENQTSGIFNLIANTAEYDLPSNFNRFDYIQVRNTTQSLVKTTKETVIRRGDSGASEPSQYYIYGNKIGFWPTPNQAYTVDYLFRQRLANLSDSQESVLPSDYDRAIIKYAAYLAWSSPRGNAQEANNKLADYERVIDRLFLQYTLQSSQDLKFTYQTDSPNYYSDKALYY